MKVLQINTFCGTGSTGRIATDLYDVLMENGHECCIAYGRGKFSGNYNTIKIGSLSDIYTHVLLTRFFDLHGRGSIRATKRFIKEIETYNPDIIHLHNLHGYYLNYEILFRYLSSQAKPVIWLLHDQWTFSGHSAYFDLDEFNKIPTKNLSIKQKKDYPKTLFFDNSEKNYAKKAEAFTSINSMKIITPSNWLANLVRKSFLSKYPVYVINNGIDLNKFKPIQSTFKEDNGIADKKVILGVASIWEERKGLKYFNDLVDSLSSSFKIVLIGITDKDKKRLDSRILTIERTENIEELAKIYTAADIFVNPTLEDNFPTTNIEALACGTPVITFNTGGSPESLTIDTGMVVEKGNSESLINAVKYFDYTKDYTKYTLIQSKKYEKQYIYNKYLDLYEEEYKNKI